MDNYFTNVEERIVTQIKDLGLKQLDICEKTGLSATAVSQYCTGKRIPDTLSLYKIATVLNVSMEWILTGKNITSENSVDDSFSEVEQIKKDQHLTCDGSPLLEAEADLVAMYRLLPEHQQEDVFDLVYFKYRKHVERKKESIYWTYTEDRVAKQKSGPARIDDNRGGTA